MVDSPRRRWPYFAISVLGLAIGVLGMQRLLELSAPLSGYPINPVVYPARLGRAVVGSSAELRFITQSRPAGSTLEIRSDAGVVHARLEPQLSKFHLGIILLEGLIFLAVSLLVLAPRVDRGPIRDLYWCTLLYGIATMINGLYFPRAGAWTDWAFSAIWIACLSLLPVLFFRMSQTFPRRRKLLERRPRLMRGLWIAAAVLIVWQVAAVLRYFADPRPGVWQGIALPRSLAEAFLAAAVGLGCLTLYRSGRKLEMARERDQTKWLLWGFAIGVAPYVFLRTLPRLAGITPTIPPEIDRVFELAIPIAFTFAIVRYRFLDINIVIRRSLIYGIVAVGLASIYLLVGVLAAQYFAARAPQYVGLVQILGVAFPVILYTPARRWIGTWVDRTFFKTQHDYAQAILVFQDAVRGASSQEEIAELCRGFLEEQLVLHPALVITRRGETLVTSGSLDGVEVEALLQSVGATGATRRLIAASNSTSRPDLELAEYPAALSGAGFKLAAALSAEGRSLGGILLGEKESERRFIEEDLKLVYAVRAEVESALERVEHVQRAAEESLSREGAEEIERFKRDFFSRVAHDLRTPLTSIRWTVQNLLDGVGGRPEPEHVPHLQAVDAAANQLGRLVNNLLELSRLDHPGVRADFEPVDLVPLVQESIGALRAATLERNVQFELNVAPGLRPVCGSRDQLSEVVANLLENAARYSPNGASVEITLDRGADGQTLVVRDHGPGLPLHDSQRIFERFEQGRPSPYSGQRGFGLGLYVARSYLTLMQGSISAGNHPEGGAIFRDDRGEAPFSASQLGETGDKEQLNWSLGEAPVTTL